MDGEPNGLAAVRGGFGEPVRVATVSEVAPGEAVVISRDVATTHDDVALVHTEDGEWLAVDNTCSHALAALAYGWVEQDRIVCPLHAAQFCLRTGEALSLPAAQPIAAHPTEIRGDEIWLHPSTTKGEL